MPSVSAFRQENGTDRWTATVTFVADGDYVLNFKTTDKAGNSYKTVAGDFSGAAAQNFTIDKTAPQLTIGGITTNTAYKKVPTIVVKRGRQITPPPLPPARWAPALTVSPRWLNAR